MSDGNAQCLCGIAGIADEIFCEGPLAAVLTMAQEATLAPTLADAIDGNSGSTATNRLICEEDESGQEYAALSPIPAQFWDTTDDEGSLSPPSMYML